MDKRLLIKDTQFEPHQPGAGRLRQAVYEVIFEASTMAGRAFDIVVIACILFSVLVVMLDSVEDYARRYGAVFSAVEWTLTLLFTVEYALRLYCLRHPLRYAASFYGIIDLVAIAPSYLGLLLTGAGHLLIIRVFRVLRVFRLFRLTEYSDQATLLVRALRASRNKITVFFSFMLAVVVAFGCLMYVIEGREHGFTSIPRSIYWAIVTVTTVGYGDMYPQTNLGKFFASLVMVIGYAVIAVPTGIFTAELSEEIRGRPRAQACPGCGKDRHEHTARYCCGCGGELPEQAPATDTMRHDN